MAQSFSWDHMAKARHRGSLLLLMPFQFLFLRGPEGGGIRLGGRNLAVGIIISLLNTIHSTFDFFFFFLAAVSIFNLVFIPIKFSVCYGFSPARFNCPYLNSLIKSIVCFQIM